MTFKLFSFKDRTKKWLSGSIVLIIVLLIAAGLVSVFSRVKIDLNWKKPTPRWYAIFLDNNQAYFGQIVRQTKNFVVLKNVYYLQVQQSAQEKERAQGPQLSLVRLKDEIHGPEDEMKINRNHILFIEQLRADSQIVQKINEITK